MLTANNRARSLRMMPNHQQAQQMQAPAMGLFTQSFEKPQATWSDKLGLLGGKLMDMDGTLGSGNFAQAQGAYDRRVSEAQSAFDQERTNKLMMAAASGDQGALFMLDPSLALGEKRDSRNYDYRLARDQVGDARYQTEYQDGRNDRSQDVQYRDSRANRQDFVDDRSYKAATTPKPGTWQSAGDGVIFNNASGDMRGGSPMDQSFGGESGYGYMPPVDQNNGFILAAFGQDQNGQASQDFNGIPYAYPDGGAQGGPDLPRINPNEYNKYRGSSLAKSDTQELERAREYGRKYSVTIQPKLETMKSALTDGVPTGPMSGVLRGTGEYVPALRGVGPVPNRDELGRADTFDSVASQLVLDMASLAKGSMSDSDRAFFQKMAPQLAKTNPQMVIDAIERQGQRDQEYADGAELWSTRLGGLSMPNEDGKTFYQAWTEYASANPIVPAQNTAQTEQAPIRINDASGYDSIPSGATYIAPDGITRRKP